MRATAFLRSGHWNPTTCHGRFPETNTNPCFLSAVRPNQAHQGRTFASFSVDSSKNRATALTQSLPPLVVVGSANADIYVEIDRLPKEGETISAKSGQTLAGGKGANQAACGGKLSYPTFFMGQVGEDAHGSLIRKALESGGVNLGYCSLIDGVPTGHAVVMLQSDGQNSIIIVGGANMRGWPEVLPDEDLEFVKSAGIVLLQREIPDSVNIQIAKASVAFMLNFYLFLGNFFFFFGINCWYQEIHSDSGNPAQAGLVHLGIKLSQHMFASFPKLEPETFS